MKREILLALLGAAALARSAAAQNARKVYRLGVLAQSSRWMEEVGRTLIVPELARQGFVEGSNLVIDFLGGPDEDLPRLAGEIMDRAPDAILTVAAPPTRAAQTRTSTVPIVLYGGQDAVVEGFAETLARPGRNVTAVVIMSVQLESKRLQLLHEAVPAIRRVTALLYGGDEPLRARQTEELQRTAAALGLELRITDGANARRLCTGFHRDGAERGRGLADRRQCAPVLLPEGAPRAGSCDAAADSVRVGLDGTGRLPVGLWAGSRGALPQRCDQARSPVPRCGAGGLADRAARPVHLRRQSANR